ncbi:MAG: type II secretion system minor pseudopilin GspI [Candidatus Polarisedimenticolaceae bacterium]|nr:type II secretion system minor pseudopilin GspI [Candidatus Polarisedimenticolaceae bacterium]
MTLPYRQSKGFTLLEVLISLAILTIALGAIVQTTGNSTNNLTHLVNKSFAHWVALNKATELQIEEQWPTAGNQSGEYEMANRAWHWQVKISETNDINVRKMEISVSEENHKESPLISLIGFLGKPSPKEKSASQ